MDAPADERALDPEGPVALALAPGERVDRVIGATRRLGVGRGEGFPDEAADGANAARAQLRDRVESVVLVAEHRIEPFLVRPAQILGCTDLVRAGLRDVGVRPGRIAGLGRAAPAQRARAASGAGEDERAVADLLESERSWRVTTPCPLANHFETSPTLIGQSRSTA